MPEFREIDLQQLTTSETAANDTDTANYHLCARDEMPEMQSNNSTGIYSRGKEVGPKHRRQPVIFWKSKKEFDTGRETYTHHRQSGQIADGQNYHEPQRNTIEYLPH